MYHQLVHLLDLCTYCYQLHSQTLIWPMDPYYEQWSSNLRKRYRFHAATRFMSQGARGR